MAEMSADVSRALAIFIARTGVGREASRDLAARYAAASSIGDLPAWLTEDPDRARRARIDMVLDRPVEVLDEMSRALVAALDEIFRLRHVRTTAGAKKYGLPIGSVIGGGSSPGLHVPGHAPTIGHGRPAVAPPPGPEIPKAVAKAAPKAPRTSAKDRLVASIDSHLKGDGSGDPFDGYSREQLRQVAKARGIKLDRGEDQASIGRKLLAHAGGAKADDSGETPDRTPTPEQSRQPKPATPRPSPAGTFNGPLFAFSSEKKARIARELTGVKAKDNLRELPFDEYDKVFDLEEQGHFSDIERNRITQDAWIASNTEEWRRIHAPDMSDAELKAELGRRSKDAWAGKPIAVRVTPNALQGILGSGRLKSQFETNTSQGLLDPNVRANAEAKWYGIPRTGSDPSKRPIYGYVAVEGIRPKGDGSDYLDQYGGIQVFLKDSVRDRTTAMWGDSLNQEEFGVPEPVNNPTWRSYSLTRPAIANGDLTKLDRDVTSSSWREKSFVEAQVHGGVSTADIAEVVLPSQPSPSLRAALEQAGVDWRVS